MIDNATIKISSFRDLKPGWNFDEGVAPTERIIELATRLNAVASVHGFKKSNAFLGSSGEIQLCFYIGKESIGFTVEIDESITYVLEVDGEDKIIELSRHIDESIYVFNGYPRVGTFHNIVDDSRNYEICGFKVYQYFNGIAEVGKNTNVCLMKIFGFNPRTLDQFKYYTKKLYISACYEFYNPFSLQLGCHQVFDVRLKDIN